MLLRTCTSVLLLCFSSFAIQSHASEFDQYLQEKKILDKKFKILKKTELNEILSVLSAEDSRTLPLQVDNNTLVETLLLDSEKTHLKGQIITPDFAQFEQDLGSKEVEAVIRNNLLENCSIFFEHQYQKTNPYSIELELRSEQQQYQIQISQKDCKVN
jgi:hypothetical protein